MNAIDNKATTPHRHHPAWLLAATFAVLLFPNIWLSAVEPMTAMARTTNILLPAGIYALLLSLLLNPARTVWMLFPLIFLSAFQLVLLYLYGHSIIAVDMFLNLVTTNAGEVGELLGSLLPAMIGVCVIFLPMLYIAAIRTSRKDYVITPALRRRLRIAGCSLTAAGALGMAACHAQGPYRAIDDLYPVNVFYNLYLAFDRSARTSAYPDTSRDFTFDACLNHPVDSVPQVCVLVIGETARAGNFGLYGYSRDTTPLTGSDSCMISFPRAYTQSNTTHKSVPMLMSAAHADDYDRIYHEKGIITAFREAGYTTAFLSNQRPNHSFIDIFGKEAHLCRFLKEEPSATLRAYDSDLLAPLDSLLAQGHKRLFVVLHTYGSHFKYRERYPHTMARFTPDQADEVTASNRRDLVNAYDNTILYTDSLLHSITQSLRRSGARAAMLYTSDHGENIFDDERALFLHASPRPSEYELHVPLLIWLSDSYRTGHPVTTSNLEQNSSRQVLTSASVFHTMLTLGGIDTPVLADTLSLASPRYIELPYTYLTDRNIPLPIDRAMLRH